MSLHGHRFDRRPVRVCRQRAVAALLRDTWSVGDRMTAAELASHFDYVDWTAGVSLRQARRRERHQRVPRPPDDGNDGGGPSSDAAFARAPRPTATRRRRPHRRGAPSACGCYPELHFARLVAGQPWRPAGRAPPTCPLHRTASTPRTRRSRCARPWRYATSWARRDPASMSGSVASGYRSVQTDGFASFVIPSSVRAAADSGGRPSTVMDYRTRCTMCARLRRPPLLLCATVVGRCPRAPALRSER